MNKHSVQLTDSDIEILQRILLKDYNHIKRDIRWERKCIAEGRSANQIYTITDRQKVLKEQRRLLKKLCHHLKDRKWSK